MTRRLTDLMQVGKELVLGDDEGSITVYLRKLTPIDLQAAIKHANAFRSRTRTRFKDPDSDEFQSALSNAQSMGRDAAIDFLISVSAGDLIEKHESQIAAEDEWSKDSYLEGLRDSWKGGLEDIYFSHGEEDPEREEANQVFAELKRYADQVEEALDAELQDQREVLEGRDDDWLFQKATEKVLEHETEQAWLTAYREAEIFYGVREGDDHNKRYFNDYNEVRNLSAAMVTRILEEFHALNVEPSEGKESGEAPTS